MPAGTPLFVWLDLPVAGPALRAIIEIMQLVVKRPDELADLVDEAREILRAALEGYAESSMNPAIRLSLPPPYGRVGDSDLVPEDLNDQGLVKRNRVSLPGVSGVVTVSGLGTFTAVSAAAFGLKDGVIAVGHPTSAGLSSGNWSSFETAMGGAPIPTNTLQEFMSRPYVRSHRKPGTKDGSHKPTSLETPDAGT